MENIELSQAQAAKQSQSQEEIQKEEEELRWNARVAQNEIETQGKKYFKPRLDAWYRLTFDRKLVVGVRAQPSAKLEREIKDKNDATKIVKVPALEWVHEITHISGNKQIWSITSKNLVEKILEQVTEGKSVIDIRKRKTGQKNTDVEYDVVGVR
jgi:hypothetical protein